MNIVWGKYGGRKLKLPRAGGVRPLTQQIRMGIFNTLFNFFPFDGAKILDLFCGSGSFGIEALSQGASVDFVDRNITNTRVNLAGIDSGFKLLKRDCLKAMTGLESGSYDLIFMDPPFDMTVKVRYYIEAHRLIRDTGIVIIRFGPGNVVEPGQVRLKQLRERSYGDSLVRMYGREKE